MSLLTPSSLRTVTTCMLAKRPREAFEDDSNPPHGFTTNHHTNAGTVSTGEWEEWDSAARAGSASRSPTPTPKLQRLGSDVTSKFMFMFSCMYRGVRALTTNRRPIVLEHDGSGNHRRQHSTSSSTSTSSYSGNAPLICTLPPTCNPPHNNPTALANSSELESHYAKFHAHVCAEGRCGAVFPDARLLELVSAHLSLLYC